MRLFFAPWIFYRGTPDYSVLHASASSYPINICIIASHPPLHRRRLPISAASRACAAAGVASLPRLPTFGPPTKFRGPDGATDEGNFGFDFCFGAGAGLQMMVTPIGMKSGAYMWKMAISGLRMCSAKPKNPPFGWEELTVIYYDLRIVNNQLTLADDNGNREMSIDGTVVKGHYDYKVL
uniref:Uncharacterized protein n=1 Tax=Oryza sativa subsp. japonica TaxID=39947 RepID=Q6Z7I6_ORYSJ|nr:hypothetical protein [Oryza sativa Japonica Group]